jgi:cell fate regulator YaaT (PSP1 superfamily)
VATDKDLKNFEKSKHREAEALVICREKARQLKLDMKLVSAHFLGEESKVLFFFTADERVDFRNLVKDLVSVFKMRIELRQIGVRDESRVIGGLAVCGRPFCCHQITDKLRPVSIKMAKEQNLSLNSMKISGPCGRLLCCLSYEYDFYREEKGKLPSEGSRIKIGDTTFRVQEVNLLSKNIRLSAPDGRMRDLPFDSVARNEKNDRWEMIKDPEPPI